MSSHKAIDRICCAVLAAVLVITLLFMHGESLGIISTASAIGYENRIFDTSRVHTVDIVMEGWESFLETCTNEEYEVCLVVIDGEAYKNVAIRAKGNTSLSSVKSYGNDRYSFKIEFDHYDSANSYYGLDKLVLNNLIQDNTMMKDFLTYQMMLQLGAAAPLCSFSYITVNGEDFGLYLSLEAIEESFLRRNFGNDYGELYKPDSMNMGGGGKMGGMAGSSGALLGYAGDDPDSYSVIFDNAKTDVTAEDKTWLIAALQRLSEQTDLADTVDVDRLMRYFAVHNFVVNFDSYTGSMIHNYYLYEEDGVLSMLPWDYNLAFGSFGDGDAESLINYPIDDPTSGSDTSARPMLAWIFASEEYTAMYHDCLDAFIADVFESGWFTEFSESMYLLIAPYVEKDPTRFCTYAEFETGYRTLVAFCEKRAESVRGQLDGSIPSTAAGQEAGSASFVSADGISISDMGSMGGGNGSDRQDPREERQESTQTGVEPSFLTTEEPAGQRPQLQMQRPQSSAEQPLAEETVESAVPEELQQPSQGDPAQQAEPPQRGGQSQRPNMGFDNAENRPNSDGRNDFNGENGTVSAIAEHGTEILLCATVIVLLGGILFAAVYKRR